MTMGGLGFFTEVSVPSTISRVVGNLVHKSVGEKKLTKSLSGQKLISSHCLSIYSLSTEDIVKYSEV